MASVEGNATDLSGGRKGLEGTGLILPVNIHGNLKSAHDDIELKDHLKRIKIRKTPAVISYGASWVSRILELFPEMRIIHRSRNMPYFWFDHRAHHFVTFRCHVCRDVLPTFCNLSNEYPKFVFIYADVDECPEATKDIRYTPTFRFFRDGDRVDEFYGAGQQRLCDRLWLHS